MRNDKKNEPNIDPALPNGFCMKLLNARKIGTNDKKKRSNPMPTNAIPTCRSRGPDSPKNVAPAGDAKPGPPTMLLPLDFDVRPRYERLRGKLRREVSGRGFEPRTFGCPRSAAVRLRQNPMSPTLHQAEPPRRAAHEPAFNKGCDAPRSALRGGGQRAGPASLPSRCSRASPSGGAPSPSSASWNSRRLAPRCCRDQSARSFLIISLPSV